MPAEPTDAELVRFLLHELPEGERSAIQESLFTDPMLLERVRDVENDLIDALVRGELSEVDAAKVREFVTASGQQDRLRFAAALAHACGEASGYTAAAAADRPAVRVHWFSPAATLAFACALLSVGTVALWMQNQRLRAPAVTDSRSAATSPGGVYAFAVQAGAVRGGEEPLHVKLPPGTSVAQIDLPLEAGADYTDLPVALRTAAGDAVWSQSGKLARGADRVSMLVPAHVLGAGAYEAPLSGGSGAGGLKIVDYYYFRVD
jgi:hypothetical protein